MRWTARQRPEQVAAHRDAVGPGYLHLLGVGDLRQVLPAMHHLDLQPVRTAKAERVIARRVVVESLRGEDDVGASLAQAAMHLVDLGAIGASLNALTALSKWRMELHERADGLIVVNDAYNANPESMTAALRTLAGIGERSGRPTVAVLGEMRELGASAHEAHAAIGRLARELGIDRLHVVGEGARAIGEADPTSIFHASVSEAVEAVRKVVALAELVEKSADRFAEPFPQLRPRGWFAGVQRFDQRFGGGKARRHDR